MADEEKQAEETEQPKKSKKLLFLIVGLIGLIALGGGVFFAYKKFLAPPPVEEEALTTKGNEAEVVGEMFAMKPFIVNLADPKGKRYLKIKLSLELETPELLEKATKLEPKLQNIVIMMLTSLSFEEVMTPEGKVRIRDELQERFNQVIRPDKIKNIYFTEFVVQ